MKSKNLVYISYSTIPSLTANSVHVMKMCNAFLEQNNEVYLFGFLGKKTTNNVYESYQVSDKIKLNLMRKTNLNIINRIKYLYFTRKKIKSSGNHYLYGRDLFTLFFLRKKSKKIIYEAHQLPSGRFRSFIWNLMLKVLSKRDFKVVVISRSLKEDFIKKFKKIDMNKVFVIHDSADIPNKVNVTNVNTLVKLNSNNTVGYIGSLNQGKGIDRIIKIAKSLPDINFYIVGGGTETVQLWKKNSIGVNNVYFHGYVEQKDLNYFYENINIFLAPYSNEVYGSGNKTEISRWMSPLKIFEYMSYKKIIISSDIPVLREVLKHLENAILVDPEDYIGWKNSILMAFQNKNLQAQLSDNAFIDFISNYTWSKRAERVMFLYE